MQEFEVSARWSIDTCVSMDRAMIQCGSSSCAVQIYHLVWAKVFIADVLLLWLELHRQKQEGSTCDQGIACCTAV